MIRESTDADRPALKALYEAAFPDETLWPLVEALLAEDADILSLSNHEVTAHVMYSLGEAGARPVALLGPLAIAPEWQGQGWGRALVQEGFTRLDGQVDKICVLGDPAYYSRFGFKQETDVRPPYELREDHATAWQSRALAERHAEGPLMLPAPWRDEIYWG